MLIAALDVGAASANSSNTEITFYSDNCGGQGENKFLITAYIHVVTYFQIHSVIHKQIVMCYTHNEGDSSNCLKEKSIEMSLQSGPVLLRHSMLQLLELQGWTERKTEFRIGL